MSSTSRRVFLGQAAALPFASSLIAREALGARNLGVQLYTVRNVIGKDPLKMLEAIQQIGYTEVEAVYESLPKIGPALKQTTLKPASVHVDEAIFIKGGSGLDAALSDVKQHGFEYVVVPYVPVQHRGGAEMFKRLADTLNTSGQKAQANGLKLCYHNHAFELKPIEGKTGLEMLMSETDTRLVSLELDVFWAAIAGHDPVELLRAYSGRVPLLHLKDKAKSFTKVQYNEEVPHDTFKEDGNGSIDFPVVLKAADAAGAQHYFVEKDYTAGDPIKSLQQSFAYLSKRFAS